VEHVDVDGMRIAFRRQGEGPPLLLLHGAVCDSRVWRVELESLADAFTVVAWDAPGCGGSSDAPATFRMGDYGECLAGFIAALHLDRPHVLGHSWGSTVALELCLRRPELVRSLVLVGAYAGWAGSLPADEVARRLEFALGVAERDVGAFEPSSMRGLFSEVMPDDRAAELADIMRETRPGAARTMAVALAESDLSGGLDLIEAPTLLVYGDADERSDLDVARKLHASIRGSSLVVLPGLGHECYLESSVTFEAAVREFLVSNS
jgi:pimeloyl-ACP methyl ester carboxylesterase